MVMVYLYNQPGFSFSLFVRHSLKLYLFFDLDFQMFDFENLHLQLPVEQPRRVGAVRQPGGGVARLDQGNRVRVYAA